VAELGVGHEAPLADEGAADARADGWQFRIKVIRIDSEVYRFITALPDGSTETARISDLITNTFRKLTNSEVKALQPLQVKVVTVAPGETMGQLAGRMRDGEDSLRLFKLINGMEIGSVPIPGEKVKIITDS
jgi:predicted Zn-dependent protease